MRPKQILILGGYGSTGLPIARLLCAETDASLILAGRTTGRAQKAANQLNENLDKIRVTGIYADAADAQSLQQAFEGMDLVVVASSTAAFARQVAEAAIAARVDYLDVQYSSAKFAALQSLTGEIEQAGLCFITDCGFHPGLPAALVRFAALEFDRLESAVVGSVIKVDWMGLDLSPSTIEEFVGEFKDFQTLYYKGGSWKLAGFRETMLPKTMDFGGAFGRQYCMPMFLEEMRPLPVAFPSLQDTGFYVGGFNWVVDWVLSPVIMAVLKLSPNQGISPMARLMHWGLVNFSRPPYGTLLKLEAAGIKDGKQKTVEVTLSHPDGYMLTAIPVVACLLQYLEGSIRQPGLWLQANLVEPRRFMGDLERLGVEVKTISDYSS